MKTIPCTWSNSCWNTLAKKTLIFFFSHFTRAGQVTYGNPLMPWNQAAQTWYAQATLPAFFHFVRNPDDLLIMDVPNYLRIET